MKIFNIISLFAISMLLFSCGNNQQKENSKNNISVESDDSKQLNITFLLDLSDRIEPSKYPNTPEHWQRDIAVIDEFVEIFKKEMNKNGNLNMKGKMRVLFSPAPKDESINEIAKALDVNTADMKPAEKKEVYKTIVENYQNGLKQIYDKTISTKNYIGSDIWKFFKNDVKDLAIDSDKNKYRNILVILTDGYVYHENSKIKEGNRLSYILPKTSKEMGIDGADWKSKMKEIDFGLIAPTKDLENLEVLVLEVNPSKYSSKYEEDIQKEVLSKWLKEMGVKKFEIYKTDIPQTTKKRIENFMN